MRLLVAEDERDLAEVLGIYLERNHFAVDVVNDGRAALDHALSGAYDAIILDILMPKMDGITVLKRLREAGILAPVMMLTAKGQKEDRILGFDSGADDYLPKPFAPDELLSRIRALLRRRSGYQPQVMRFGDLALDSGTSVLSCGEGSEELPRREFQILELLMGAPSRAFSADEILERIWGWDAEAEVSTVWVHISNLRKRLKSLGSSVQIKAVRGLGYRLVAEEDASDAGASAGAPRP